MISQLVQRIVLQNSMANIDPNFSFGVRLGLVFIVQSAFLSAIAVSALLGYVIVNAFRNVYRPPPIGQRQWHFLRTPVDHYFLSLLVSDLVQAVGAIMDIRWVQIASVRSSSFCTAQGIIKQIGDVGVALSSAAIALHTFGVLFARLQFLNKRWVPLVVVGLIWLFLFLVPLVSGLINTDPPYYGPSTYWCWIDPSYYAQRIGLEYGLLWFVAALNILLYGPLFLFLRGNIQVEFERSDAASRGKMKLSWKWIERGDTWKQDREERKESFFVARQMLAYPIVYIILILPMSIVRWTEPTRDENNPLPSEVTAFAGIIFSSSGLVNVLLYVLTRPALLPSWRSCRRRIGGRRKGSSGSRAANNLEDGRTGAMPEMTMLSFASGTGHQQSPGVPRIHAVPPPATGAPMLADDDDTDDEFSASHGGVPSPTSPTSNFSALHAAGNKPDVLAVPQQAYRNSWGSEASKYGNHSQEGSGHPDGGLKYQ